MISRIKIPLMSNFGEKFFGKFSPQNDQMAVFLEHPIFLPLTMMVLAYRRKQGSPKCLRILKVSKNYRLKSGIPAMT
jgi:hypothetical protein